MKKKLNAIINNTIKSILIGLVYFSNSILKLNYFKMPERIFLSWQEVNMLLAPNWYHDFSRLGFKTNQTKGSAYQLNQDAKEPILFDYIKKAIKLCKATAKQIKGIELFCADGYYSNFAVQNGVDQMLAIDLEEESGEGKERLSVLSQGRLVAKILGNEKKVIYEKRNVFEIQGEYDLAICAGGLYHIENPQELLKLLFQSIRKALIIQTVVSLENTAADYFETPAPTWTWGCRFSHKYLQNMVRAAGWKIIEESQNELGNSLLKDRGSSYLLCVK